MGIRELFFCYKFVPQRGSFSCLPKLKHCQRGQYINRISANAQIYVSCEHCLPGLNGSLWCIRKTLRSFRKVVYMIRETLVHSRLIHCRIAFAQSYCCPSHRGTAIAEAIAAENIHSSRVAWAFCMSVTFTVIYKACQ